MDIISIHKLKIDCPVCGKRDWCGISSDGLFAFCPRIEQGSVGEYGSWGYIHPLDQRRDFGAAKARSNAKVHWEELKELYQQEIHMTYAQLALGVGWDGKAWVYPVYNEHRNIVGMQRRFLNGHKLYIKGSKDGIFWPLTNSFVGILFITEGASDCMVAMLMGFEAIGRSNCAAGKDIILKLLRSKHKCRPVIIADNDRVGIEGAKKLQKAILAIGRDCGLIIPPAKDLRQWYEQAGDDPQKKKDMRKKILEYFNGSVTGSKTNRRKNSVVREGAKRVIGVSSGESC